jgi:integrase
MIFYLIDEVVCKLCANPYICTQTERGMFNYSNDGITVSSIIDERRQLNDGSCPVKVRVTYKRERKYYATGKSLSLSDWEKMSDTKSKKLIGIRTDIQYVFDKVKQGVIALVREDKFSLEALNTYLGKGTSETLNDAFHSKMETLLANEQINTYHYYGDVLKSIEAFAGKQIPVPSVTVEWLQKYEKKLVGEGKSYATIGMRGRALRCIMNELLAAGLIKESQYPFGHGKYEIPTGQGRKLALSIRQIKSLVTYTDGNEATEHARDLWFFSYLCNGINFAYIITLKYSNIHNGEIYFYRAKTIRTSKTKKEIAAIITPEMQAIINRWGNPNKKPDSYIFGFLNGDESPLKIKSRTRDVISNCNRRLRKIGIALGIEGLSTYSARHSFATVLKRSGANISYISESLGHNDLKTTENYLASFEKEERMKNASFLTNFGE